MRGKLSGRAPRGLLLLTLGVLVVMGMIKKSVVEHGGQITRRGGREEVAAEDRDRRGGYVGSLAAGSGGWISL